VEIQVTDQCSGESRGLTFAVLGAALSDYAIPVRNLSLDQKSAGGKRKNTEFGSFIIIDLQEL